MFNRVPKLYPLLLLSCVITLTFLGCNNSSTNSEPQLNLWETVQSYQDLSKFSKEAEAAGLDGALSEAGYHTLITPTDDAFDRLPEEMLDTLSTEQMEEILEYHIVEEIFTTRDMGDREMYESATGENLFFVVDDSMYVNGMAALVAGNMQATNGILHAVEEVLLPDSYLSVFGIVEKRYLLQPLQDALLEAELSEMLNTSSGEATEYTVLAPTESALSEVDLPDNEEELANLLKYHIIEGRLLAGDLQDGATFETMQGDQITIQKDGDAITVNENASITTTDLAGTNGVVHIIDAVLAPPSE